MGQKTGWAQPVSQRGAQAPATPATPFAAAQTQLSAFPASVLTPEPLCPPLTGALSFTAATVACSWSPWSSLHCGGRDCPKLPPRLTHAVQASAVAAWRPRLWSPRGPGPGTAVGGTQGPALVLCRPLLVL